MPRSQFEAWLAENGAWDDNALAGKAQEVLTAQRTLRDESEAKANRFKRAITLGEWHTLTAAEREACCRVKNPKSKLNSQDGDSIEWASWSWNPVTGCNHGCSYCFARDIANRFYPQKFEPSFVPEALSAPINQRPPRDAHECVGYRNVFTCSMADLFGGWVPKEWIDVVLGVARQAKDWNFLVLTKFPQRLTEFEFPPNVWVGCSVDLQARVKATERAMREVKASVKWLSLEPLIEPIQFDFSLVNWVVIGGASQSTQTPAWQPPRKWVIDITHRAMAAGCSVYHKTNLNAERLRNYPGFDAPEPVVAPSPFHYLKGIAK
jgi:protein gp37